MPRFKSLSSEDFDLFASAYKWRADSFAVASGEEVQVAGEVTEETEDAYIVGEGDEARAWSKTLWELVDQKKPAAKSAPAVEEK